MKREFAILARLLTDWTHATQNPALCRAMLYAQETFHDSLLSAFARGLLVNEGSWQAAMEEIPRSEDKAKVAKLRAWAARITRPKEKRVLLLTWPGSGGLA